MLHHYAALPAKHIITGAGAVVASGVSGAALGTILVGGVAASISLALLVVTILANKRKSELDWDHEMQASFDRGKADMRMQMQDNLARAERSAEYWRDVAIKQLGARPMPGPPDDKRGKGHG